MVLGVKTWVHPATRLVGLRGLDALLEGAAVGDAAKGARNELRIVGIAEAEEDLVLLGGVEVPRDVEGVRVLE